MTDKTIGWIGTGIMGKPMAMHLVRAGHKLNVFNRTKEKAGDLLNEGCQWFDSAAAVAANSDIIFTMIGFPEDVEEVYFGERGIISGLKENTVLIDMTTTKPSLAQEIFTRAKKMNSSFVDAPVSGGETGAINGELSIMVGGEKETVDLLNPLFKILGRNIVYQGPAGTGQHTKMCNQIVIAGTMVGVCESLLYGYKAGLNLNTVLESISKGAAGCWTLGTLAPKIINNDFAPGFIVEHFIKDLGIALEEAEKMKLFLPGLALAKQLYLSVKAIGGAKDGTQALYKALAKLSNIEIPVK